MSIKKTAYAFLVLALAGCSASQLAVTQQDMNNVAAYGPPYTVAKLQSACQASSQAPADKLLKAECVKLSVFAKACSISIPSVSGKVNAGLAMAGAVLPQADAVLAANQVAVAVLTSAQFADCTAGGFVVGAPTPGA